ncbi:hypothetical protein ACFX58_05620 [Sphingomonas sp. NCPPB 2930]
MSAFKQIAQLVDAPLAIVVGSVGAVLIAIQLGAVGMVAQAQVDKAHERDAQVQEQRIAVAHCLGAQGTGGHAACVRTPLERSPAVGDTRVTTLAVSSVAAQRAVVAGDVGLVPVGYTYSR